MINYFKNKFDKSRRLFGRQVSSFDFNRMQFKKLDVDLIAEELKLYQRASENACKEIPSANDELFDGPQEQIIYFIQGHCAEAIAEGKSRLSGLNYAIENTNIDRVPKRIAIHLSDFRSKLENLSETVQAELKGLGESLQYVKEEVNRIIKRYNLDRPAVKYNHDILAFGIILASWFFQASLNTYFFAIGHELGLIGGLSFAAILSLTDVIIATVFGVFSRHVLVGGIFRLLGAIGIALGSLWIVFFNLIAAHLREALQKMPLDQALRLAQESFLDSPLGLEALDSWLLFLLGLVFSASAYFNGWNWNDPVPGYGKAQKKIDEVIEELFECIEDFRVDLNEIVEEYREIINNERHLADDSIDALKSTVDAKKTLLANLQRYINHVEHSCNALISGYRDANRQNRQTPPPPYFQQRWEYPIPVEFKDDTSEDTKKLREQLKFHKSLDKIFEDAYKQIDDLAEKHRIETKRLYKTIELPSSTVSLKPMEGTS